MDLAQELFACTSVDELRLVLARFGIDSETGQMAAPVIVTPRPDDPPKVTSDYPIPGPYEIALQLGCALASTGRYETPGAAMHAAWTAVPEFFQGRDFYLRQIVPIVYGQAAPPATPDAAADEDFRA